MKKGIFIVMFAMFALIASAQSDYSSYLDKALEKLEAGDCESAQKNYNVYKELSGEEKNSVQIMIDDCQKTKIKKHYLGEKIWIDGRYFRVANLDAQHEHGFAIREQGTSKYLFNDHLKSGNAHLMSMKELEIILTNKHIFQLSGKYWTSNVHEIMPRQSYWVIDVDKRTRREVYPEGNGKTYKLLYVINF